LFDIDQYILEKKHHIFQLDKERCSYVINHQKNTGDIYFCKRIALNGKLKESIVLKHYHNSETLFLEYDFAKKNEASFREQNHIRIPSYKYLDKKNMIVVTEFVENNITFEKLLLTKRNLINNRINLKWFLLAGRWLAHFHKVSISNHSVTLNSKYVINDLRKKWLQCFQNSEEVENNFLCFSDSIKNNDGVLLNLSKMHREYGPGNILLTSDKLYGIDFGNNEMATPYDDISYFIISCITLNHLPHHPLYKKLTLHSEEFKVFLSGYLDHYPFINIDPFNHKLFILFLWKNLIRRISGQLSKANNYPKPINFILRNYIYNNFKKIEQELIHIIN